MIDCSLAPGQFRESKPLKTEKIKTMNKDEILELLATRGQPHLESLAAPLAALINPANKTPLRGAFLEAPAGGGKSSTARFCAEITGAEFYEVPAWIRSMGDLIGDGEKEIKAGWKGLAWILNLERSSSPKIIYFEEFGKSAQDLRAFILDLSDTTKDIGDGKWGIIRQRTLIMAGTNEGMSDPAIAGASGRMNLIPLEFVTESEARAKLTGLAAEYGAQVTPGGLEALLFYSPRTHRGLESIAYTSMLGGGKVDSEKVLRLVRPPARDGKPCRATRGPGGMAPLTAEILKVMVASPVAMREGTIKSEAGAAEYKHSAWKASWNEAKSRKWIQDAPGGFASTDKAISDAKLFISQVAAIKELDAVKAPAPAKAPAPKRKAAKAPAKGKAKSPKALKGGKGAK